MFFPADVELPPRPPCPWETSTWGPAPCSHCHCLPADGVGMYAGARTRPHVKCCKCGDETAETQGTGPPGNRET